MKKTVFISSFGSILLMGVALVLFIFPATVSSNSVSVDATVPALCGNGVIEGAEACDDGNQVDGDGCSAQCVEEAVGGCGGCGANAGGDAGDAGDADAGDNGDDQQQVEQPPVEQPVEQPVEPPAEEVEAVEPAVEEVPQEQPAEAEQPPADQPADAGDQAGEAGGDAGDGGEAAADPVFVAAPVQGQAAAGGGGGGSALQPGDSLSLAQFSFFVGNRRIATFPKEGVLSTLTGDVLSISVTADNLPDDDIANISLVLQGERKIFRFDAGQQTYFSDIRVPASGVYDVRMVVRYNSNRREDVVHFSLQSQPYGQVLEKGTGDPVLHAQVTLFDIASGDIVWQGASFGQSNPAPTGDQGAFAFVVPNGTYRLEITADGYRASKKLRFVVSNHVVNGMQALIKKAPTFDDVLTGEENALEAAGKIAEVLGAQATEKVQIATEVITDVARRADELADDPVVEEVTEEVVAPSAAGIVTATVAPSLWGSVVPFLRYIFLQPLLLLGRRKRKEWGVVYNSLTKLPVDLAVVRLINKETGSVQQSRVTDGQGRYLFIVEPGDYTLEVTKQGFQFPSTFLKDSKVDGQFIDIYHGEEITTQDTHANMTPNIPVDPTGAEKPPSRIKWEKRIRGAQQGVASFGIVLAGVSVYINPSPLVWGMLSIHVMSFAGFWKFIKPKKPAGWGIVYNQENKKPLANAVVRLFTKEYNKLISTQITDRKGRYAFLVGPSNYYVTSEKPGFSLYRSNDILIEKREATSSVLKKDIYLVKGDGQKKEEQKEDPKAAMTEQKEKQEEEQKDASPAAESTAETPKEEKPKTPKTSTSVPDLDPSHELPSGEKILIEEVEE